MTNPRAYRVLAIASTAIIALASCDNSDRGETRQTSPSATPIASAVAAAPPVSSSSERVPAQSEPQNDTLKIKGFYIGMKISEALNIFNSRFTEAIGNKLTVVKNPRKGKGVSP